MDNHNSDYIQYHKILRDIFIYRKFIKKVYEFYDEILDKADNISLNVKPSDNKIGRLCNLKNHTIDYYEIYFSYGHVRIDPFSFRSYFPNDDSYDLNEIYLYFYIVKDRQFNIRDVDWCKQTEYIEFYSEENKLIDLTFKEILDHITESKDFNVTHESIKHYNWKLDYDSKEIYNQINNLYIETYNDIKKNYPIYNSKDEFQKNLTIKKLFNLFKKDFPNLQLTKKDIIQKNIDI